MNIDVSTTDEDGSFKRSIPNIHKEYDLTQPEPVLDDVFQRPVELGIFLEHLKI